MLYLNNLYIIRIIVILNLRSKYIFFNCVRLFCKLKKNIKTIAILRIEIKLYMFY